MVDGCRSSEIRRIEVLRTAASSWRFCNALATAPSGSRSRDLKTVDGPSRGQNGHNWPSPPYHLSPDGTQSIPFRPHSARRAVRPDSPSQSRQLVAVESAGAISEDERKAGELRLTLLAAIGRKLSDQAAVRSDGRGCRLAGADGLDARDGRRGIKQPGSEGQRGACGMRWEDRVLRFGLFWQDDIGPLLSQRRLPKRKTALRRIGS